MREREAELEALRTRNARKFTGNDRLADEVTECFEGFFIGGGDYVVELLAPEGLSTGGGKQALQHVRLRPRREGYADIVAGSVNLVEKHAELRTFEHALLVQQLRFKKPLEITPAEWEQLVRRLEDVLRLANLETQRVGPSPDLLRDVRAKKGDQRISPRALALFIVVVVLAAAVLVRVLQILSRS
jgi:hypothetical protein